AVAPGSVWRHVPLLAGLLLCGAAALSSLTLTLDQSAYEMLVFCALIVGIATSAVGLWRGRLIVLPGAIVMLAALSLFALRVVQLPIVFLLYPPEVMADEDLVLATMIGWLLVAFAFWQSSRANLIFLIVAGLAIFGLMGTINLNVEMRVAFALFVLGAVFCWSYEQFLDMDDRLAARGQPRVTNWLQMAQGHLSIAVLVAVLTFGFGSLIGTGAYRVSPNLYAKMAREMYGWTPNWNTARKIFNSFETQFRVGTGPVRLLPWPVMEVQADHAALWRAMAHDYYDGHGWSRTKTSQGEPMWYDGQAYHVPPTVTAPIQHWRRFEQHVKMQGPVGVIPAAAQPETLRPTGPGGGAGWPRSLLGRAQPTVDAYGCLNGPENEALRTYTVISREPIADPQSLRSAVVTHDARIISDYTPVPGATQAALEGKVQEITGGLDNPYDKVRALQTYLQRECVYSLGAAAVPRGEDAAAYFVLHSRRGACDLFATALAVMSRLAGVPARVATGYQTGRYDRDKEAFVVEGTDAHAWAEIYFPGHGWVPFDPQAEEQFEDMSLVEMIQKGHLRWVARDFGRRALWVIAIVLIVVLATTALVDPLRLLRSLWRPRLRTPLQRLSREYQAFYEGLLRRHGVSPNPALTPEEAMRRNVEALAGRGVPPEALLGLNERFYDLRYAEEAPEGEVEALRRKLQGVRKRLRRR
ncbi:MAG: transglutaminase-like domain-containing protein, partial [Armatimonadetes bacterium]|nr:transglutaminase-like domain-containing protein [Armatimonadota bacterium]